MEAGNESDPNECLTQNTNSSSSDKGRPLELSSEDTVNTENPVGEDGGKLLFDGLGDYEEEDTLDNGNETDNEKEADDKMELDSDCEDEFSDDEDLGDEEMDESEIDLLLEEGLPQSKRLDKKVENVSEKLMATGAKVGEPDKESQERTFTVKKIVALEEKGGNTFEVMPSGWIQVRHNSGMPVFLHRKSRVCCMSKPYYLGPASVRRHLIPVSGIPCMAYRRALEKEQKDKELLETQVEALESQVNKEVPPLVKSNAADVVTKCSNAAKMGLSSNLETATEKVKGQKRKLEGQEIVENVKKDKQDKEEFSDITGQPTDKGTLKSTENKTLNDCTELSNPAIPNVKEAASTSVENLENIIHQKKDNSSIIDAPFNNYKRGNKKLNKSNMQDVKTLIPLAKVETARENASLYSVSHLDLREYCRPLFKFTELECRRFKTWGARRRHTKEQKRRQLERPTLPENAQVIKFFDLGSTKGGDEQIVKKFNDYVFNPNGKSSVCILHEFVQHALRKQPTYTFQELENAATPYSATVMINEIPYGKGYGSSKKTAKAEAAKVTLEILIPQMKGQLNGNKTNPSSDFDITEYFQQVDMSDPRISKMCTSVSEPSPYSLLLTCLQRSFGKTESSHINFEMLPPDPSKGNPTNQFKMSAGEHSVTVNASNKREGKQLASQLLLSKIHPHITNFGAFLKMYGNGSIKSVKEKKQEEQQITTLQSKASANSPNWAILTKLRQEMMKLAEHQKPDSSKSENIEIDQNQSTNQSESDGNTSESANAS